METTNSLLGIELWHKEYNLEGKDNLDEIPAQSAVFGIFGIVNDEPVNCRYIGEADNLHETIKSLFENPGTPGLKKFMQGAWIQMMQYRLMPDSTVQDRELAIEELKILYKPNIDEQGDYPGYYND